MPRPIRCVPRLVPTMLLIAAAASAHGAAAPYSGSVTGTTPGPSPVTYTVNPLSVDGGGGSSSNGIYNDRAISIGHIAATTLTGGGVYTLRSGYIAQLNPLGASSGGNTAPFFNTIPLGPIAINEDAGTQSLTITGIGDGDTPAQTLTVSATSSNLALMLNPTVVYSAGASTANLLFAPVADAFGSTVITVRVQDNGSPSLAFAYSFTVTVNSVNDPPSVNTPADVVVAEDSGPHTVNLTGIGPGAANESGQVLAVTALSSDTTIIPNPTVTYASPANSGSLSFTSAPNANGTVTILVRVADDGGGANVTYRSFTVTVTPVPDAPVLVQNQTVNVVPGGTTQISNLKLQTTDDGGAAQITYSLTSAPTAGDVLRLATIVPSGGTFTQSDIDGGLISYRNTNVAAVSDSFTFSAVDGDGQVFTNGGGATLPPQTFALTISGSAAPNTTPIVQLPGPNLTWTEGDPPVLIDPTAVVTDPDNLPNGELLASLVVGGGTVNTVNDRLAVRNIGTGAGQIGVSGSTVTYGGVNIGSISATDTGVGTNPLRITFTATATVDQAAVQALLRAITYANVSQNPVTSPRQFQVVVTDGYGLGPAASNPVQKLINVAAVNSAPTVAWSKAGSSWTEGSAPVVLDNLATVTDLDSPTLNNGRLTVSFGSNGTAADTLDIWNEGVGAGQVSISGTAVSYGGSYIGDATGGTSGTPLLVTFNAGATPAIAQAVLAHVQFSNTSQNPSTLSRVVQAVVNDGDPSSPQSSTPVSITVAVTAVNNPPVVNLTPIALDWTELATPGNPTLLDDNQATVAYDPLTTVTDVDSANFAGGALLVSFTGASATSFDTIGIMPGGAAGAVIGLAGSNITWDSGSGPVVIGSYGGNATWTGGMTVLFNANATPAAAQALIRALYFDNTSTNPTSADRTVQVQVLDGNGGTSAPQSMLVHININDAPPVVALSVANLTVIENAPATAIAPAATVTDNDSATLPGGFLTVSFAANGTVDDRLTIHNRGSAAGQIDLVGGNVRFGGTVIGTWSGGTDGFTPLTVLLNGSATAPAVEALLREIEYTNVSDNPSASPPTIQVVVNDGQRSSSAATMTVTVTPVNDAPIASNFPLGTIDGVPVMVDLRAEARVTDPDSPAASIVYTIQTQPPAGQGAVAMHATRANTLVYTPPLGFVGATSFTYSASDTLASSAPATVNVYVTRRLGEARPFPLTDAPRLAYHLNAFRYDLACDVSQLGGIPGAQTYRLAGDAPDGVSVTPTPSGARVDWADPLGTRPAHQEFGVIFTDPVSGTSGFIPLQYILLPDPNGGG